MDGAQITNPLKDPQCPECGCVMWLDLIEPRKPGYEERIFQCPRCLYSDSAVVEVF
jgi:hypothetical protein